MTRSVAWASMWLLLPATGCAWLGPGDRSFPCRTDVDCVTGWSCGAAGFCVEGTGTPDPGDPVCGLAPAGTRVFDGGQVLQFGAKGYDNAWDALPRSGGGWIVVGDIENPAATDSLATDGFLAWLRADGSVERCVRIASTDPLVSEDLVGVEAVPGTDDVVVAGHTWGDAAGGVASGADVFVGRYGPDGTKRWHVRYGFDTDEVPASDDIVTGLVVDAAGRAWIAGTTLGGLPGRPERPEAFTQAGYVAVLDASGALLDGRIVPSRESGSAIRGFVPDADGVAFGALTQLSLGDGGKSSDGYLADAMAARLGSGNKVEWRLLGEVEPDVPTVAAFMPLALAAEGDEAWVGGLLTEGAEFDGVTVTSKSDGFIARATGGRVDRTRTIAEPGAEFVTHLALGTSLVFVLGVTDAELATPLLPGGREDLVLWTTDRSSPGTPRVLVQLGGDDQEAASAMYRTGSTLFIVGTTQSALVGARRGGTDSFLWTIDLEST